MPSQSRSESRLAAGFGRTCQFDLFIDVFGYSVLYLRAPRLFETKGDRTHLKTLTRLAKVQLLILDDLLISPLLDDERRDLREIIERTATVKPLP